MAGSPASVPSPSSGAEHLEDEGLCPHGMHLPPALPPHALEQSSLGGALPSSSPLLTPGPCSPAGACCRADTTHPVRAGRLLRRGQLGEPGGEILLGALRQIQSVTPIQRVTPRVLPTHPSRHASPPPQCLWVYVKGYGPCTPPTPGHGPPGIPGDPHVLGGGSPSVPGGTPAAPRC